MFCRAAAWTNRTPPRRELRAPPPSLVGGTLLGFLLAAVFTTSVACAPQRHARVSALSVPMDGAECARTCANELEGEYVPCLERCPGAAYAEGKSCPADTGPGVTCADVVPPGKTMPDRTPIPRGYVREIRRQRPENLGNGAMVFGSAYAIPAAFGLAGDATQPALRWGLVPVVGPFVWAGMATREMWGPCRNEVPELCGLGRAFMFELAFISLVFGVGQVVGATMMIDGLVTTRPILVRKPLTSWRFTPLMGTTKGAALHWSF